MDVPVVTKIAKYLNVPLGTISTDSEESLVRSINGQKCVGVAAILLSMVKESKTFEWRNQDERYHVYQWLEFVNQFGCSTSTSSPNAKTMLKELNAYLEGCSYLVGYSASLADVVVYHSIYNLVASLSPSEKESYIHVCRWFDHIQFSEDIRQDNKLINFSSNHVTNIVKVMC